MDRKQDNILIAFKALGHFFVREEVRRVCGEGGAVVRILLSSPPTSQKNHIGSALRKPIRTYMSLWMPGAQRGSKASCRNKR